MGVSASIRGRVEDLGGSVTWTTRPGGGCVVRMTVPRTSAPARRAPHAQRTSTEDAPTPPDGTPEVTAGAEPGPTVLVADDHPLWLSALERDLTGTRLRVVATATDGPATVRRARATRPDVLVLDLNLPGHARRRGVPRDRRPADPGAHPLGER